MLVVCKEVPSNSDVIVPEGVPLTLIFAFVPLKVEPTLPTVVPLTLTLPLVPVNVGVTLNESPLKLAEMLTLVPVNVGVESSEAVALFTTSSVVVDNESVNPPSANVPFIAPDANTVEKDGDTLMVGFETLPTGV